MTLSTIKMTAKQFLMIGEDPPGVRMELAHGEVAVSPSPTPEHQDVVIALAALLRAHVRSRRLGRVFADVDTRLDRHNIRRPDVSFVATGRLDLVGKKALRGAPDLCVEVISPRSRRIDRKDKFELYRKRGVNYYWIVDPARRTIEAYRLADDAYVPCGGGRGSDVVRLPPFEDIEIPLPELWEPVR